MPFESNDLNVILADLRAGRGPAGPEAEEAKARVESDLFETLRKARVKFEAEVMALYRFMRDPKAPVAAKGVAIAALLYFVLPIDVVPDFLPVLGFADDAAVIAAAVAFLGPLLAPYRDAARGHAETRADRMRRWRS